MRTEQIGNITLHNCDNMKLMKSLPDGHFDLAIVDPPYGSSIMKKNKFQRHGTKDTTYRNKEIPDFAYFEHLHRVAKRTIIWGCQYMIEYCKPGGSFIVWDKGADPDLHNMSAVDIAWYSERNSPIRKFYGHWCGAVKCESEPTIHIHQKPVKLYKWLLDKYAKPGERIFDSHLGSGSIAIACHDLKFELTACEIDPDYFQAALKRLRNHVLQTVLF